MKRNHEAGGDPVNFVFGGGFAVKSF